MVVSFFIALISSYWQMISQSEFLVSSFDWLITFLDSFTLSGLVFTSIWYYLWKDFPGYIETLYKSWFYIGVALNVLIIIGSLHLDWSWGNFGYQLLRCIVETSLSFVQIFGILSVLKTLADLNTNTVIAIVIVYFVHHFGFGENIREFKTITNTFIGRCLDVDDNTDRVIDLIADSIGLNSSINTNFSSDPLHFDL